MSLISSNKLKVFLRIRGSESSKTPENFRVNFAANTLEMDARAVYSFTRIFQNCEQGELFDSVVCPLLRDVFVNSEAFLLFPFDFISAFVRKTGTVLLLRDYQLRQDLHSDRD